MKNKAIKWLTAQITDEMSKGDYDIVQYLKGLVRADKGDKTETEKVDWQPYFDYLWKIYPRKVGKQNAIKQYEKKVRGLTEEETKFVSQGIYSKIRQRIKYWEENETEMCYIPHFASFLNAEIQNSKHYKGR